jgi:hypothetical protein
MIVSLRHVRGWMVSAFSSRENLILENLALRQQLLALHAKRPRRRLAVPHKLFWVALKTFWSDWTKPLVLGAPRIVVSAHYCRVSWHGGVELLHFAFPEAYFRRHKDYLCRNKSHHSLRRVCARRR